MVRIDGSVDRRSDAEVLEQLVRGLEGVSGVDMHVTWAHDDRVLPLERAVPVA